LPEDFSLPDVPWERVLELKVGDKVRARWFDDRKWYEGTVQRGHYGDLVIYHEDILGEANLEEADEVRLIPDA
jgi:hypothetical protein